MMFASKAWRIRVGPFFMENQWVDWGWGKAARCILESFSALEIERRPRGASRHKARSHRLVPRLQSALVHA